MKRQSKVASLILAAGASTRMGQAKQLLPYNNTTLLNHIVEQLKLGNVERTFIVLGAYADEIAEKSGLDPSDYFVFNDWENGMGSSLAFACSRITEESDFDALLITLADLPFVRSVDYEKLIQHFNTENDIVASEADDYVGVPAVFGKRYFEELKKLKGETGAKSIINKHREQVLLVKNEKAVWDVDTPESLSYLGIKPGK